MLFVIKILWWIRRKCIKYKMKYKNLLSFGITDFGRKKQYKKTVKMVYINKKIKFLQ